mgnify:CR=1 FL=1
MEEEKYRGLLGDDGYIDYDGILNLIEENDRLNDRIRILKRKYKREDENKPCDCEDPDYAYYWHDASGCFTVIHGAAECSECGKAWKATQEGNWTIHFDRPTKDPYTG